MFKVLTVCREKAPINESQQAAAARQITQSGRLYNGKQKHQNDRSAYKRRRRARNECRDKSSGKKMCIRDRGKTQAIHFFEDLGYFCIDNMPPALIPMLANMLTSVKDKFRNVALVIDIRVGDMINAVSYTHLRVSR